MQPSVLESLPHASEFDIKSQRRAPSQELGEIFNLKFVYFLICNVVDASALYVQ
jgi:hypothetical protein